MIESKENYIQVAPSPTDRILEGNTKKAQKKGTNQLDQQLIVGVVATSI